MSEHPSAPTESSSGEPAAPVQAGMAIRLAALIYDGLLLVAVYAIVGAMLTVIGTPASAAAHHELTVLPAWYRYLVEAPCFVLVTWLFYGWCWRKGGQTLGMQTWRLKAVRQDGRLLSWNDTVARFGFAALLPVVCGTLAWLVSGSHKAFVFSVLFGFFCNYLWIYGNARALAWHDQLSRTLVLRLPPDPKKKRQRFGFWSDDD